MSREDEGGCKLSSVYKHKERKPKKPHYIPRPWGKPYNYKCFQCPFTCMEKSHLYNHMKYSLCKNSLSLLIESDWPYKKGNLLHPELQLLQATEALRHRSHQSEESDTSNSDTCVGEQPPNQGLTQGGKAEGLTDDVSEEDLHHFQDEEEEEDEEEDEVEDTERKKEIQHRKKKEEIPAAAVQDITVRPDLSAMLLGLKNRKGKLYKDVEPDFAITDVYSLKTQMNKSKESAPLESEIKPKQCKIPPKCLRSEEILMEQWKLQGNSPKKGTEEVRGPEASSMPCYPPPAYSEYHEHQGLNLSLLGINYPLSPNLFSYLAPTMAKSVSSHPHLAQLPFLASGAQLMQPHSTHFQPVQSHERPTFLPGFYYPLLFEHSFGASDGKMTANKTEFQKVQGSSVMPPSQVRPSMETQKDVLNKMTTINGSIPWTNTQRERPVPPDLSLKPPMAQGEEEKWTRDRNKAHHTAKNLYQRASSVVYNNTMISLRDGASLANRLCKSEVAKGACLQTTALSSTSLKRKSSFSAGTDTLRDLSTPENQEHDKFSYQSSLQGATQPLSTDQRWSTKHDPPHAKIPGSEALMSSSMSDNQPQCKRKHLQAAHANARGVEVATLLIGDLSKTLDEYQEVEQKLSDMAKKDNPEQKELREQLVKIRCELHHVQQALEKASKPHEGPLDLSVKRSMDSHDQTEHDSKEACREPPGGSMSFQCQEDTSSHRSVSPTNNQDDADMGFYPSDSDNQTIEMMIKMSRAENLRPASDIHLSPPVKAETLPQEQRHALEPYYNRTTKCEADSSVLLSTDGRSSQAAQAPPQPLTQEECKLAARLTQHAQSCGVASGEVEIICVHSPLSAI